MRRAATLAGLALAAWLAGTVTAAPAYAHAALIGSTPSDGQDLAAAPAEVVLTFSEPVTVPTTGLGVLDAAGANVDDGSADHPSDRSDQVRIGLRAGLPAGAYVVSWRVVSVDAHPLQGAFSFTVGGAAPLSSAAQAAVLGERNAGHLPGVLLGTARWAGFAGLALLLGGAVFLLVCWPEGRARAGPDRLVGVGTFTLVGATFAEFLLQGPYASGRAVGDALDEGLIGQTADSRFGWALIARVLLVAAAAWLAPHVLATRRRSALAVGVLVGAGLLATWGLAGHPSTGIQPILAMAADSTHLAAMAVWVGGLVFLSVFLLRTGRAPDLARALPRFSPIAFGAIVVLAVTGTYQGWRQVGALGALPDTAYGRLLLGKIALFTALIMLGNLARRFVARHYRPPRLVYALPGGAIEAATEPAPPPPTHVEVSRLRRSVGIELLLATAVLVVTAILVATPPARGSYVTPYAQTLALPGGSTVRVELSPARAGDNQVRLAIRDSAGQSRQVPEVRADLRLPARDLGPLPINLEPAGPGAYTAPVASVPFAGKWELRITVRVSEFDAYTVTATVPVQ